MGKNYYETCSKTRDKILRRFSAFDGVGLDLRGQTDYESALDAAGLNYSAVKKPIFREDGSKIDGFFESAKSDDENVTLGIVGNQYNPISNKEAFSVAEEIQKEGWANYEAGGPCYGSKNTLNYSKSFLVLRGEDFDIQEDTFNSFVILNNSFDGSSGVNYKIICQRVVCMNGMVRYLGDKKSQLQIDIQHSKSANDRIKAAKLIMGEKIKEIEAIKKEAEAFINTPMTRAEFEKEIIPQVLKAKKLVENDKERERGEERVQRVVEQLIQAYDADDVQNYNNSAYRAILALSDFETHAAPLRDCGNAQYYLNNLTKGMLLTSGIAKYIANTRGLLGK